MLYFPKISSEIHQWLIENYPDCFESHQELTAIEAMQLLRGAMVASIKKGVSNLSLEVHEVSGFSFRYFYTRQNLVFNVQPSIDEMYPGLITRQTPYFSSFQSSGQSAMAALFIALMQVYKNFSIDSKVRPYFETPLALRILNHGEVPTGIPLVLIDSTRFEPSHLAPIIADASSHHTAIIDTSLWAWNEPLLQDLLENLEGKLDIFLVRSHLKLDCLGGEYSTLGSIVYLPSEKSTVKEIIVEHIGTASSSIGSYPSLDQIYPFYKDRKFQELTLKRIQQIKESLRRILPKILSYFDEKFLRLEIPYHGLFIIYHLKTQEIDFRKHLLKMIRLTDGPVALVDSYGFDFPSVLTAEIHSDKGTYLVRMNGHTLGSSRDAEIIDTYKNIILTSIRFAVPW